MAESKQHIMIKKNDQFQMVEKIQINIDSSILEQLFEQVQDKQYTQEQVKEFLQKFYDNYKQKNTILNLEDIHDEFLGKNNQKIEKGKLKDRYIIPNFTINTDYWIFDDKTLLPEMAREKFIGKPDNYELILITYNCYKQLKQILDKSMRQYYIFMEEMIFSFCEIMQQKTIQQKDDLIKQLQYEQKDCCVYYSILKKDYNKENEEYNLENALYLGEGNKHRISTHKNEIKKIRNSNFLYADIQISKIQDDEILWVEHKTELTKTESLKLQNDLIQKHQPCFNIEYTVKNYKCHQCGKKFHNIKVLENHQDKCFESEERKQLIEDSIKRKETLFYTYNNEDYVCQCGILLHNASSDRILLHQQSQKHVELMNGITDKSKEQYQALIARGKKWREQNKEYKKQADKKYTESLPDYTCQCGKVIKHAKKDKINLHLQNQKHKDDLAKLGLNEEEKLQIEQEKYKQIYQHQLDKHNQWVQNNQDKKKQLDKQYRQSKEQYTCECGSVLAKKLTGDINVHIRSKKHQQYMLQ